MTASHEEQKSEQTFSKTKSLSASSLAAHISTRIGQAAGQQIHHEPGLTSRQGAQALKFLTRKVSDMAAMTDNLFSHDESNNSLREEVCFATCLMPHYSFQSEQAEITSFESRI